ncbi:hypothetical protein [Pseudalkalibacillus sp. SCS-8]|uniref:hypothetical protein n=1 Tax=Pseudalkalibacillus nanhaiensis TaxID=3115291 RepID=UPI0032DAAF83
MNVEWNYDFKQEAQLKKVVDVEQLQADAFRGQRFSLLTSTGCGGFDVHHRTWWFLVEEP